MKLGKWIMLAPLAVTAVAQDRLPQYSPRPLQPATIRSWGDGAMRNTMIALEQRFRKYHPQVRFQDTLLGSASGMAGIITGTSDLSILGRPATPNEIMGFEWVFRMKPVGVKVMNGNLEEDQKSPALAVFVSRQNPVDEVRLAQLGQALGCPADASRPTWKLFGATGSWAAKPIHAYLYDDQTGTGSFLQRVLLGDRDCWNWDVVREFKDEKRSDGSVNPAARQIAQALEHDPDGLAISTLRYGSAAIKPIRIQQGNAAAVVLSKHAIISGAYPLARGVYIYINRPKDSPVDPTISEFLHFVLSEEGQNVIEDVGDFLPLDANTAWAQRQSIE